MDDVMRSSLPWPGARRAARASSPSRPRASRATTSTRTRPGGRRARSSPRARQHLVTSDRARRRPRPPRVREDERSGRDDRGRRPLPWSHRRPAHARAPRPARTHVHRATRDGAAARREPVHRALGLRPRPEDELARRIEDARDPELAVGGDRHCRSEAVERHLPPLRHPVEVPRGLRGLVEDARAHGDRRAAGVPGERHRVEHLEERSAAGVERGAREDQPLARDDLDTRRSSDRRCRRARACGCGWRRRAGHRARRPDS
jgi:hypothetical protein